jgi:CheY-like chemotaxis protein
MSRPRKPRVLCLDDEPHVLESLRDTLRREFEIVITTNGFEALRLLAGEPFAVVVADMRMPLLNGARFLALAREHAPDTVRVMLTGQAALPDAAGAVNDGDIFKLLIKPCKTDDLKVALEAAVSRHVELRDAREAQTQALSTATSSLIRLAACVDPQGPARADRIWKNAAELAGRAEGIEASWELEQACALMQLGAVSVSPETRARAAAGTRLGPEQAAELERLPEFAVPLLPAFTRLEPVAELLTATAHRFTVARPPIPGIKGNAAILRIALDFEVQICQGAPMATAVRALHGRTDRYDPGLLAAFSDLMQFT